MFIDNTSSVNNFMQRFIDFYNELNEGKIIKRKVKEEETSNTSGELTEPSLSKNDNLDILKAKDGSIGTTDILGKCDHQKSTEGFFGKDCFHIAKNVFNGIDRRVGLSADQFELNESEQPTEYTKAFLSMKEDPKRFLSTKKTIDLEREAIQIPYSEQDYRFSINTDMFKDIKENVQLRFMSPDSSKYYYSVEVKVPSLKKAYSLIPSTADLIRMLEPLKRTSVPKDLYVGVNNVCFDLNDQTGHQKVFHIAVDESVSINEDTTAQERVDAIIQRELEKIYSGNSEFSHQQSKIDRVKKIPRNGNRFDYGKLILSYREKAKSKIGNYSMIYLSDKAIQFIFDENVKLLKSISFASPYAIGMAYKPLNVKSIPMDVLLNSLENQRSGKSILDNETSNI